MSAERAWTWGVFLFLMIVIGFVSSCGDPYLEPVCEAPPQTGYIVGGDPSEDRRATVFVTGNGFCSGTVVGPLTVLTAAHCPELTDVYVDGDGWYNVVTEAVHPQYDFPNHDLRLLYVDRVLPEPYATLGSFPMCTALVAQGYGLPNAGELYEVEVEGLGRASGVIYAGVGICNGDSGGPLWSTDGTTFSQVGVSSFGYGEPGVCNGNTGFVDLDEPVNLGWIQENIR